MSSIADAVDLQLNTSTDTWSQGKGASWLEIIPTHVLYKPGQSLAGNDTAPPAFLMRSSSCKHPKHRAKLPRPIRHWRRVLRAPIRDSNTVFTGGKSLLRTADTPHSFNKIGASNEIYRNGATIHSEKDRAAMKQLCKSNVINTITGTSGGWQPQLTDQKLLRGCCNKNSYDMFRIDPYNYDYKQYLRNRRKTYESCLPGSGVPLYCNTSLAHGQNANMVTPAGPQMISQVRVASETQPVTKPLFVDSNNGVATSDPLNYVLPGLYRPGVIGADSSGARIFAKRSNTIKHGGKGFYPSSNWKPPHVKQTPYSQRANYIQGSKTYCCFKLYHPNGSRQSRFPQLI